MLTAHLFAGQFAAPGRFLHVLFKINFASFRVIEFDSFKKKKNDDSLTSFCRKPYFLEPGTTGSPSTSRSFTIR